MIYPAKNLKYTLFLDIETVSEFSDFNEMSPIYQDLWQRKALQLSKDAKLGDIDMAANLYKEKAGIFAEYAKVVCISLGFLQDNEKLRIKSIYGDDEVAILQEFSNLLINYYDDPKSYYLCGHNIKEFDIPFLCRRMVKHGVFMPNMFDIAGKKPWQTEHLIDTLDLWRFGDIKNYTSLNLLAAMLGINSPKDDIDGSMVGTVYWNDRDVERIKNYCQKDVITVVQIMMKFCGLNQLVHESIELVSGRSVEEEE